MRKAIKCQRKRSRTFNGCNIINNEIIVSKRKSLDSFMIENRYLYYTRHNFINQFHKHKSMYPMHFNL